MKYYAVIDTNVLVSAALKYKSIPGSIVRLAFDGLITPVLNSDIEKEYREVLSRPKFHFPSYVIDNIINTFRDKGLYINPESLDIELPDPKDKVFYEVVMEKRKDDDAYLVTGNMKHFPVKPFVVTPREMLDIILKDNDALTE